MKVLHIANGYFMSSVHSELVKRLDDSGVEQVVYNVMQKRCVSRVGENYFEGKHIEFCYSPILKLQHKFLFFAKTRKTLRDLLDHVDLSTIDVIHASTSNSDGAVALELHKRYEIPYIVAVRNTDIDIHARMPHLWHLHRSVLKHAARVICITPLLRDRLISHPSMIGMKSALDSKVIVVHNGVNSFWIDNARLQNDRNDKILYVGKFDRNKNVLKLIEAVRQLRAEFPDLQLDLVGGDGAEYLRIMKSIEQNPEWLHYFGKIYDKEKLKEIYRNHSVFAMVSLRETFGLVYIEAMSQGLKVLYSKGQGIDKLFSEKIGEGVHARSISDIKKGVRKLLSNHYDILSHEQFVHFDWDEISNKYIEIYKEIER